MKIVGGSVLVLASVSVAEIVLVGSCTMRQAAKVCEAEGLSLARVDKRSIGEVEKVMGSQGAERAWSAHSDPSVIIYSSGKGHRCSDNHIKLPCLCYRPDEEPKMENKRECKRGDCKGPKPAKKVCKKVIKKEMKRGHHEKCCKQDYYERSFTDSESWTSTHVSQEIKTRVPKKCRRHVYKCHSSTSSCSDSPKPSESCESTSYTTEEVVRPHKRVYYHKQVEVKDRVCPKEIRQEVFKKKKKPCAEKQCEKRRMKCHNGTCQLRSSRSYSRSNSSGSYSSDSYSSHRLQKRAFGEDEIDAKVKNIKTVKASKDTGKDRFRAPIKFPSSCSTSSKSSQSDSNKSSVSISSIEPKTRAKKPAKIENKSKKPAKSNHKSPSSSNEHKKLVKKPVKKHDVKVDKKPAKTAPKKNQRKDKTEKRKHGKKCRKHECKPSERFVYKIKKGKACEAPYVKVPSKRTREIKIVSDISKHKKDKPAQDEVKESKRSSGSTKTSSRPSRKPASRKRERKPARKSESSATSKSASGSSGKHGLPVKVPRKTKMVDKKAKAPDCPRMKCKNGRCELKRLEHHRHRHHHRHHPRSSSSSSASSSSSSEHKRHRHRKHNKPMGYKQKVAKRTEFTPISTSSTPHRTPVVLQKRHVRCN